MPITKRVEIDQIIINPLTGNIGWRETTVIEEDGKELSRAYHRTTVDADFEDFPGAPSIPPGVTEIVQLNRLHSQQMKEAARARRAAAAVGPPIVPGPPAVPGPPSGG